MHLTPDQVVLWRYGFVHLNATILCTWILMAVLTILAMIVSHRITADVNAVSRLRTGAEAITETIRGQVREVCGGPAGDQCVPFVGTLFLFIAMSNMLHIVPEWHAPTASLSTTVALAISVGVAVPVFGMLRKGFFGYLADYFKPTWIMFPLHLLSETSRNLALAVRLFGNIMSEAVIVGVLLSIAPLFIPILMQLLGLITGLIQAYIFSILATVYLAAALRREKEA